MQFSYENELVKLQGQGIKVVRQCYLNSYLKDTHLRLSIQCGYLYLLNIHVCPITDKEGDAALGNGGLTHLSACMGV